MVRYVRPSPDGSLHAKKAVPRGIGKERDLYAFSAAATEEERQRLESQFFQLIDARAAVALQKLDKGERGSDQDRVGLVRFVISLMHRSPSRIQYLRQELRARMTGTADFDPGSPAHQSMVSDQINHLLADMISSPDIVQLVASMRIFRIDVRSRHRLLTCDLPLMLSQGIAQPHGFLMFPYAPDRVVILVHREDVAKAFSSQAPDALAKALNDAVVRQARECVIAADRKAARFIEKRFLRDPEPVGGDGLIRWQVP